MFQLPLFLLLLCFSLFFILFSFVLVFLSLRSMTSCSKAGRGFLFTPTQLSPFCPCLVPIPSHRVVSQWDWATSVCHRLLSPGKCRRLSYLSPVYSCLKWNFVKDAWLPETRNWREAVPGVPLGRCQHEATEYRLGHVNLFLKGWKWPWGWSDVGHKSGRENREHRGWLQCSWRVPVQTDV